MNAETGSSETSESVDGAAGDHLDGEDAKRGQRPLRIWPFAICILGMLAGRYAHLVIGDGPTWMWMVPAFAPVLCALLILVGWLAFSRATAKERILGFIGLIVSLFAVIALAHPTMQQGPPNTIYTVPVGLACFAIGVILVHRMSRARRTLIAVLCGVAGFGSATLLRADGMWGDFSMQFDWRWNASAEEQLVAAKGSATTKTDPGNGPKTANAAAAVRLENADFSNPQWPGFRGAERRGIQRGVQFSSDWDTQPPEFLWKLPAGPGWASFAACDGFLFTHEQRLDKETVVCYDAKTGDEVWAHETETRFDEALGGPGPRATPTLASGLLYSMGGNGRLFCLDPKDGSELWGKDIMKLSMREQLPMWGYCCSPLAVGEGDSRKIIVYAGGPEQNGVLAFDAVSGEPAWSSPTGSFSYSSPHLSTLHGEEVVLMLSEAGMDIIAPNDGTSLLRYEWKHGGYRSLQPWVLPDNSVLVASGMGTGTRRLKITKEDDVWGAEEMWTSMQLKPDFNDFVVHDGAIYGFDDAIFTCIDLDTGERNWKRGRYGKGQVLLLQQDDAESSGLLLVISEKGELVLLKADPSSHVQLAKLKALDGKTWNHPVVVDDHLYIRNGKEFASYRLPTLPNTRTEAPPEAL